MHTIVYTVVNVPVPEWDRTDSCGAPYYGRWRPTGDDRHSIASEIPVLPYTRADAPGRVPGEIPGKFRLSVEDFLTAIHGRPVRTSWIGQVQMIVVRMVYDETISLQREDTACEARSEMATGP